MLLVLVSSIRDVRRTFEVRRTLLDGPVAARFLVPVLILMQVLLWVSVLLGPESAGTLYLAALLLNLMLAGLLFLAVLVPRR